MAPDLNSLPNGHTSSPEPSHPTSLRFKYVPDSIEIPVAGGDGEEAVEVDLEELQDDTTELCTLLENENAAKGYWTTIALAYSKQGKVDLAIEIVNKGFAVHSGGRSEDRLTLLNCLCWLYLRKCREAPRVLPDDSQESDTKIKDEYIKAATLTLNDASRINPSFPPLFLARGVLCLLRAAVLQSPKEKAETLRQAAKAFEDSIRASGGNNMMAVLGRARAQFSLNKYAEALQGYQNVLQKAPDMIDPDPRVGIGCCLWQLNYKEDAKAAWQRALELKPESTVVNVLLGLYYLDSISHLPTSDPKFTAVYKKAITEHIQKAFKMDKTLPLACATFGSYFLVRKSMDQVESFAKKAVELSGNTTLASDGWYLRARKEHYGSDFATASSFYSKADTARGGDEKGYLPAKIGMAQLMVQQGDVDGAKFRLEKIIQQNKNVEAMTLLGTLFAEDVFSNGNLNEDERANTSRKAVALLEAVRQAWKDPKRSLQPDSSVLLSLARLYEIESPDKSLHCLQQVETMELAEITDEAQPTDEEEKTAWLATMRQYIPPPLLNNIACFHFQTNRLLQAQDIFQTALNGCVKLREQEPNADTDALITTITFNLARTHEASGDLDQAREYYEGVLNRCPGYTDASIRLAYISLRQSPTDEGPKLVSKLFETDQTDLEVRALYGWFLRKAKRRTQNIAEDQEQRHFKHTLQHHDKHDRYSLTGMGNLYLANAREMRRETEKEKAERRRMYERAVEFFDKALQLDPRNGYAAQGIAIALIEDKRDFSGALQILSKVKETVKDANVFINMGHVYCEVKQYSRAIENYEVALAKDRARDPQVLGCLGRVWLLRGKQEKSAHAMKTALDYSQRALEVAPDQVHFHFNVAFVQIQIAQLMISLPETQRSLAELDVAGAGLDEAIESFIQIAKSPNPPFPRHDIEQRANMGRNTMRKQLDRSMQSQREYEEKNAERLQRARELHEAAMAKRAEEKRQAEEAAAEQQRKIAEERQKLIERDRALAEKRAEEERKKAEEMSLSEDGTVKKKKSKRKGGKRKKVEDADSGLEDGDQKSDASALSGSDAEKPRKKKKRRLERRAKDSSKYKSQDFVVDSSDDEDMPQANDVGTPASNVPADEDDAMRNGADEDDGGPAKVVKRSKRVIDDDDDEDEDLFGGADGTADGAPDANGTTTKADGDIGDDSG
ncbi:MAG: hypothetical protein M1828_003999 [Chrysothrix sp. TS-e1954]|nr:MAG: hypothetical protein M1828_003999 [Chrysothrix sp. TS-e1954]